MPSRYLCSAINDQHKHQFKYEVFDQQSLAISIFDRCRKTDSSENFGIG